MYTPITVIVVVVLVRRVEDLRIVQIPGILT